MSAHGSIAPAALAWLAVHHLTVRVVGAVVVFAAQEIFRATILGADAVAGPALAPNGQVLVVFSWIVAG